MFGRLIGPRFFLYYWINGSTLVGPETDNQRYPNVKAVTWEDFMKLHSLEEISGAYFAL